MNTFIIYSSLLLLDSFGDEYKNYMKNTKKIKNKVQ